MTARKKAGGVTSPVAAIRITSPTPGAPGPDSGTWETTEPRRTAIVERNTAETRISIGLTIEGRGQYKIATGIRFFDHMLELFTRHGAFDLELKCDGDLD